MNLGLVLLVAIGVLLFGPTEEAAAEVSYVGSSTIGENIIPEASKAFTAKTGIAFGRVEIQGSGKGLELVLLVAAPGARPEVRRFLDFLLSAEAQAIVGRHFLPVR